MTEQPSVVIRAAEIADIGTIMAFGAAWVPEHYEPIIGPEAAQQQVERWWTRERFLSALSSGALMVVEEGDEIVGVAEMGMWQDEPVIWKLYVHPDRRGRGLGRRLLNELIAGLPEGTRRVLVEHFAGNVRAAAFYDREGFIHLRTEPASNRDPAAATVWRSLELPPP